MLSWNFSALGSGELVFLLFSAALGGLTRGFSGFGGALIFMPLASSVVGPKLAVPLLLIVDLVLTPSLLPHAWRNADRREVGLMAIGAIIGVPLGTYVLLHTDPISIRWAIVVLVGLLLVLLMSGWRYHGRPKTPLTIAVGLASGICSGTAQVGGPPVVAYWLGQFIPPLTVRANIVLFLAGSSCLSIISYTLGGLLTWQSIQLSLIIGPAFAAGLFVGWRLFGLATERTFRWVCHALIAGAAIVGMPALDGLLR
ncbi:sulfite exporter TauE/SafE family protein [Arvimicrobium flavum]|uniref:sulfite exporter TauE/SafE family protein n=1 Tax=Arvimicrobium flavum TaxID=3393320 RepID=UPI00237A2D20|nr:sulfite exporter TauE/SafE family protein [Mesorhizobium shangrilense]